MYIKEVEKRVVSFSPTTVCFQNIAKPRIYWLVQCSFTDPVTHTVYETRQSPFWNHKTEYGWLLHLFLGARVQTIHISLWIDLDVLYVCLREDAEPDGDIGEVEGATQGLPSKSSIQLQPPSPTAVMELDKQGACFSYASLCLLRVFISVHLYVSYINAFLFWSRCSLSYCLYHCCFPSASFLPIVFVFIYVPCSFIWSRHPDESLNCRAQFQGRPRRKRTPRFLLKPWACCSLTDIQVKQNYKTSLEILK